MGLTTERAGRRCERRYPALDRNEVRPMIDSASKQCSTCRRALPLSEFYRQANSPDGYRAKCRDCCNEVRRAHRPLIREKLNERNRQWHQANPDWRSDHYQANREREREQNRQWYRDHPEFAREKRRKIKERVFAHYGTVCACCGTTENLSIDHINGDGKHHRTELFGYTEATASLLLWLIREGFPKGYQTLCISCNSSKDTGPKCRLNHDRGR